MPARFIPSIAFIVCAAAIFSAEPLSAAEAEWEPDIYPRSNLFPSLILGSARLDLPDEFFAGWEENHLGDTQGLIGISLTGPKKGAKVEVTVHGTNYFDESTFTGTLEEDADGLLIHPKIAYNFAALSKVRQAVPLNVKISLKIDGKDLGSKTATATLRPVNDCLFGVEEFHDEDNPGHSDYSWLFTAYVNENHPWVDRLLKEALETKVVDSFDGYQSGDPEQTLLQIFAIWNAMQRRGLKYSDITTTAAQDEGVYSQHVRLFEESIEVAQANCVDGSVLLAALLRKIGLNPYLVLVPGHMFLAVDLDDETTIGLETTLMGSTDLPAYDKKKTIQFRDVEEAKNQDSWDSFEAAVAIGTGALEKHADDFEGESLQHQIIDLDVARDAGILPIVSSQD